MTKYLAPLLLALLLVPWLAQADEFVMAHSGALLDGEDRPITNPSLAVTFRIYNQSLPVGGQLLLWEASCNVKVANGYYSVTLGSECGTVLNTTILPFGGQRYLEVAVGGVIMTPRLRIGTVPTAALASRALDADNAQKVAGNPVSATAPTDGQVLKWNGSAWAPGADYATDSTKEPAIVMGTMTQYFRGDKTWQLLNTTAVAEGTNQYYTDSRARGALSGTTPIGYDSSTGAISIAQASQSASGYLSSGDWTVFNNKVSSRWTAGTGSIYYNDGNVGIGTAAPSGLLHVKTEPSSFVATGGTITTSGGYTIHTFTTSGQQFTPNGAGNVEYLVVAGGGGGATGIPGITSGAGGGAGGFRTGTGFAVTAQPYDITVGAGGAAGGPPSDGGESIFSTITSAGGGKGGYNSNSGGNGGSGGGASGPSISGTVAGGYGNTPPISPSQGNNGGSATQYGAAGGGGASAVGTTSGGGAGTASSISGSPVTYAGGGGRNGSIGGAGGGGAGADYPASTVPAVAGTANTGGGGGGGGNPSTAGAAGGSGIVIIRYLTSSQTAAVDALVVNSSTGDIGIGTTNPTVKLDVQGDIGCLNNGCKVHLKSPSFGWTGKLFTVSGTCPANSVQVAAQSNLVLCFGGEGN